MRYPGPKMFKEMSCRLATAHLGAAAVVMCAFAMPAAVLADPPSGDDLYDRYFSNVLDGAPCYARTYDDTYLKSHKAHKVRSIEIDLAKFNSDGTPNSSDRFELGLGILTRYSPEWFGQTASCKSNKDGFECFLEADGGIFHLTPTPNGGLTLQTGETGIAVEGTEMLDLPGKDGEDRTFDLAAAKDECAQASDFFNNGN